MSLISLLCPRCLGDSFERDHYFKCRPVDPPAPSATRVTHGLTRYGITWNGPREPIGAPMDDGYWTPWHLAAAEVARLRESLETAQRKSLERIAALEAGLRSIANAPFPTSAQELRNQARSLLPTDAGEGVG